MPNPAHSSTPITQTSPRHKVLIVDDELPILLVLKRTLRKRFDIHVALNANHALELLENKGPFATVISDMRMPQTDGATFLAKARQISPDTSRIMMSGDPDRNTALKAINQGHVFCFLDKPCSASDVTDALEEAVAEFEKRQATNQLTHHLTQRFHNQLHTPLNDILGQARLIRDGVMPMASVREFSDMIARQAADLLTLTETLNDLTAIQENRLTPNLQRTDLDATAQQTLSALDHMAMAKGVKITINSDPGIRPILADSRLIARSLESIVSNAIRFSETGNPILVNIHPVGEDAAFMAVEISDNGCGISSEPHMQARSTHLGIQDKNCSPLSGMELGLPFAKAVSEIHHGYLELENKPGEGAIVRMLLPVTPLAVAPQTSAGPC